MPRKPTLEAAVDLSQRNVELVAERDALRSRVEAVLVYCQFVREERSGVVVASKIERILDGGKV